MPDQIDLTTVQIDGSPDVRTWPATVAIVAAALDPSGGLSLTFDRPIPDAWKWPSNPTNPSDNYQYTVWLVVPIAGTYHAQGLIQMWQGRAMGQGALPSILTHFGSDGWLGNLGGPLRGYTPQVGDHIGILITAGNARGVTGVTSVAERSNVVAITLPASDQGAWTFAADPAPTPPPLPTPQPTPTPEPVQPVLDRLAAIESRLAAIETALAHPPDYTGTTSLPWFGTVTVVLKARQP